MKNIYLFSTKNSVINYWKKYINPKYTVVFYTNLSALYSAMEKVKPDIILFDYDGHISNLEELLIYSQAEEKQIFVMALNSNPVFSQGVLLLRKGVRAFMNSYAKPENLNQAIEAVSKGNIWLYPEFIQVMIKQSLFSDVEQSDIVEDLSPREREIAELIALGMSNKEIAKNSKITEQTVKTHLKTIYEKMHVHTRLELAILINKIKNSY